MSSGLMGFQCKRAMDCSGPPANVKEESQKAPEGAFAKKLQRAVGIGLEGFLASSAYPVCASSYEVLCVLRMHQARDQAAFDRTFHVNAHAHGVARSHLHGLAIQVD